MLFTPKNFCNRFHKALNDLCETDFIKWDNIDAFLILAILKIKEGALESYHSSMQFLPAAKPSRSYRAPIFFYLLK